MPNRLRSTSLLAAFLAVFSLVSPDAMADECSQYQSAEGAISQAFMSCKFKQRQEQERLAQEKAAIDAAKTAQQAYENSPSHSAMSYQRCVLDEVPTAQNDMAARVAAQGCQQYPSYARAPKADFIGFDSANECFKELGTKTSSRIGAILIVRACQDLYPGSAFAR